MQDIVTESQDIVLSRRRREMYCSHAHLCVCLSVCPRPHAHTIARTRM